MAHSGARPPRHGGGGGRELLHPVRGRRPRRALAAAGRHPAALCRLRRLRLRLFRSLQDQMAVHLAARSHQHRARRDRAGGVAAGARLHPGGAERLRHVLLRQDHHRALLVPADLFLAVRASPTAISATPARCSIARRRCRADAGARPRRRRRRAAARDRKRRGQEDPAGRHPVAVARRSRPVDPRRLGAGRVRRSRERRRRSRRPRHQRHAPRADADRARAGGAAGNDPDAGAPARARDQPAAVARRRRRGAAACAGQCRRPAAAAEREDRLPAARRVRARASRSS